MRPIDRGSVPCDPDGLPIDFGAYDDAFNPLLKRLGQYCSYCEQLIPADLQIEHIQPKSRVPDLECCWSNFLLACRNCNSTKKDKGPINENLDECLWPDRDNTFLALSYEEGGRVKPNPNLPRDIQTKALKLIQLVGLDKTPACNAKLTDRRWSNRREIWERAQRFRQILQKCNNVETRELIIKGADSFFSVWMTVFADDQEVCLGLIKKFKGTAQDCFDDAGRPVKRPDGQI